ncbi:hypothetical protein GOP47_0024637 [Adiantum capillus-veneris]|uniref:Uncharacterized protein n=1 Tax=Adiantum capillus-veneris TaxID=13818 RepID=A0A9D4Z4J3_ADICA|nr:hypothetical protein GOP47_0024637 [Adiantum capillus-veneris]
MITGSLSERSATNEGAFTSDSGSGYGQWLTPDDAERISKSSKASGKMSEDQDPMLLAAIKASLEEDSTRHNQVPNNQNVNSIAAAMAASLANIRVPGADEKRT